MNIFVVRAIVIRFHLGGRNYVGSDKILAFEVLFFQLGLQDIIKWKSVLHGPAWSRRSGRFWFLYYLNPSSTKKVIDMTIYTCQEGKTDARSQTPKQLMSDGKREVFDP